MFKGSKKVCRVFFLIWVSFFYSQAWSSSGGWGEWAWEKLSRKSSPNQSFQGETVSTTAASSTNLTNDADLKPKPVTDDDPFFLREGGPSLLEASSIDYGFCLLEDSDMSGVLENATPEVVSPSGSVVFYCDPRTFSYIMNQNLQASFYGSDFVEGPKCSSMIFSPNTPEIYQDYLDEVSALGSPGIRNFLHYYEVHPDTVAWLWTSVSLRQASHVVHMTQVFWHKEIEHRTLAITHVTTPEIAQIHKVHAFLDPSTFCARLSLAKEAHRAEVWSSLSLEVRLSNPLTEEHFRMCVSDFDQAYVQASLWQPGGMDFEGASPSQELIVCDLQQVPVLPLEEEVRPLAQPAVMQVEAWSPNPVAILGMTGLAVAATFFFGKYSK